MVMTWDHFTSLKAIIHYFCCSFILVAGFKICSFWWGKRKAVPLHAMVALGGREGRAPTHSWPRTRWGWVVSVTPPPPGTHCTGGWVGLRAGLDTKVRGKILCPYRGSNPDRPVVQSVVRQYITWATRLPFVMGICTIVRLTVVKLIT
jgi:hypothetical protein